jgi:hypothetical protein
VSPSHQHPKHGSRRYDRTTRAAQVALAYDHRTPTDPDTMLQQRITAWVDYHKDLHRVLARHHALATAYAAACQCAPHTPPEGAAAQDRPHEAGGAARTAIAVFRTALWREADHFAVCAQGLLNEIASTFGWYFALPWSRGEATHAQLSTQFQAVCAEKALVLPDDALPSLLGRLHTRIADGLPMIPAIASEDLAQVVAFIEQYIRAMLEVLERNMAHSVCR